MITADALSAGPRGRRMLLAYAVGADRDLHPEPGDDSFGSAVMVAAYHLDSDATVTFTFSRSAGDVRLPSVTPDDVARRLREVTLPDVTTESLRSALTAATDSARYWEEPDGEDVLADTEAVRHELHRVAEHIAGSPHAQWWTTSLTPADQWSVSWDNDGGLPDTPAAERLRDWREQTRAAELRAERERPTDPTANWSAQWWSKPPVHCSTQTLVDGTPAGLWLVEDDLGWERAVARRVSIPTDARVYEVDGEQAWAQLCRRFPVEVTAQKWHDWYRATGRAGRWVVPDWMRLAETYTGVHLTVAGYLAAAGTAIEVDAETASVIAGWAPDETYWLSDTALLGADAHTWVLDDDRERYTWVEDTRR